MERFGFVFFVAGMGFFVLAFLVSGWVPFIPFADMQVQSVEQLASRVPLDFVELRRQYPEAFAKAFGNKTDQEALAEALVIGRKTYIGEGCWHCHTQQVRPVGNDEARFGRIHYPEEFNNDLNYPALWGTRRVGPDLLRESGRQSNDWHVAHFWNPPDVAPLSVMPRYPWFFERDDPATDQDESLQPNKTGLSVIAYVQWLGSWIESHDETIFGVGAIERAYPMPTIERPQPADQPAADQPPAPPADGEPDAYGDDEYGQDDAYGDESGDDGAGSDDEYGY